MYACSCIIYENDERYQLDVTIYLLLQITLHVSDIYMPIFRSIRLYTFYTTAYGVQHCKRELCVSGWLHFMLFVVLCNCWLRLCCMLYWVRVLHNSCCAHWSGWKCGGGAGACPRSTSAFPNTTFSIQHTA